jgi:methyl-accepting chemotaxis protein
MPSALFTSFFNCAASASIPARVPLPDPDWVATIVPLASTLPVAWRRCERSSLIAGFALGIFVSADIVRWVNRVLTRISRCLNDGSSQVASAAGQVSASSQTLAKGASEQASSLEETSSSLEEMASMTKRNAENAQKANDLAKQAREAADKGFGDMQAMGAAMDAIKISSDDIAKIIKTIDEIAFQTNILALNAAVEAARAGEAGMGFAVVADEVRNLAQRCAQAAKETSGKIEGAIAKTGQGAEISVKVAQGLGEIVTKVRRVDELIAEVAGASREQTNGIAQINAAVGQMDKVTQSNAANAEESAAAAEELNSQAEMMKQSVAELLQLVSSRGKAAKPVPAAPAPKMNGGKNGAAKKVYAVSAPVPGRGAAGRDLNGFPALPAKATAGKRHSEIPLEGDFKDF